MNDYVNIDRHDERLSRYIAYDRMSDADYERLPLLVEGESKIVRHLPDGLCLIKLKPTIYSFTANRAGIVEGSDTLRLRATKLLVDALKSAGRDHAYEYVGERFIVSKRIMDPPPIEVIVKGYHAGTSKHRYKGASGSKVRDSHPYYAGRSIKDDDAYPTPLVRFDWRNPLPLADEVLGEETADLFIDTKVAKQTALDTFRVLSNFLGQRDIVLYDICLFISEDGKTVFGELSQDCGRFRHFDLGSLDKDVWRAGGSSAEVLAKWKLFNDAVSK